MSSYLVTGASRGIGLELVKQLVALPSSQVSSIFAVIRTPNRHLDEVIASSHARVIRIVITDIVDAEQVKKAAIEVENKLAGQGLDVLINNAGVMPMTEGGRLENVPVESLVDVFRINTGAAHVVTAGFLDLLRKGEDKKIINITSGLGSIKDSHKHHTIPAHAYKVSKAAMNMMNMQYSLDLGDEGFTCLAISPGWLKTDIGTDAADLETSVGVRAVTNIILDSNTSMNGKFVNIRVPGWENAAGSTIYDGAELPW